VPQHCSNETLNKTVEYSRSMGLPIHTHLAESRTETIASQQRFGGNFVQHLIEIGILGTNSFAAHGVWLANHDLKKVASASTTLLHCPASNLRLGAGIARTHEWQQNGVQWAIGTDGASSSDNLNMFTTMQF